MTANRFAIGIPLLVISGIAAQQIFTSMVTGNMVGADWNASPLGYVHVIPADTPDATAYAIYWRGCDTNSICTFAGGLAPKSTIRLQQDKLALELDVSSLSVVFSAGGEDCRSTPCTPFVVNSVPLNGTFTIYRGINSSVEQSNGITRRESIFSVYPNTTMSTSQSFSGSRAVYTASFEGRVGQVTIPPPMGGNATLNIMKGQQSFQTVYAPVP